MTSLLVRLDGLSVTFGRTPVLVDMSLQLQPGTTLGLTGPNGSGKSTLLSVLATFVRPTSGSGTVLGARLGTNEVVAIRPGIGWVGHEPGVYPELTLLEHLELEAKLRSKDPTTARRALKMVGLDAAADRRAEDSSNGMRRRLDLARVLIEPPRLLLLDEAGSGLDEHAGEIVQTLIDRVQDRGGAAVVVSHDAATLTKTVEVVRTLVDGRLT